MHDGDHRLACRTSVAVGDLHGDFFVLTKQHGRLVFAVIDQRIVQTAITRAGIECDLGKFVLLDQIDNDVGLPALRGFLDLISRHAELLLLS
jgi:hypothetical protein